ncbi:serine hydrolase domain-containing protein [Planctomycetota bacterium]
MEIQPRPTIVGRIIEVVSGEPYDVFLSKRIFQPLNMIDTGFLLTRERAKRTCTVYKPGTNPGELAVSFKPDPTIIRTPGPSGGLFSTARDLVSFYQAMLNGGQYNGVRIISEQSVKLMTQLHTGDFETGFSPGCGFGLEWGMVREPQEVHAMLSPGTYGHGGAFGTQGWIDPHQELIFILLIQRQGFPDGDNSEIRRVFQEEAVKHFGKGT